MKLADIIVSDAICPQLKATTREEDIAELVKALAAAGALAKNSVEDVTRSVIQREKQATTGIGKGIALPHAKVLTVKKPIAAIGCVTGGLDFSSLDSKPVYAVILLLSSPDKPDEHLQAMETIFKHVQRDMFRKFLYQAKTKQDVVELIGEADDMV
jgi:mannitol/fructose-specific phosphotransferase system IIA component (Ntr-type)